MLRGRLLTSSSTQKRVEGRRQGEREKEKNDEDTIVGFAVMCVHSSDNHIKKTVYSNPTRVNLEL